MRRRSSVAGVPIRFAIDLRPFSRVPGASLGCPRRIAPERIAGRLQAARVVDGGDRRKYPADYLPPVQTQHSLATIPNTCFLVAAGPVSRILCPALSRRSSPGTCERRKSGTTVIPLGRASLRGSSDLPGSCDAPSRHVHSPRPTLLPYLVLLRVGFSLPPPLLAARCALTAPFHPYSAEAGRYVFCGTFRQRRLNGAARTLSGTLLSGVRTFLCPPARPDSSAEANAPVFTGRQRPSGPAANTTIIDSPSRRSAAKGIVLGGWRFCREETRILSTPFVELDRS